MGDHYSSYHEGQEVRGAEEGGTGLGLYNDGFKCLYNERGKEGGRRGCGQIN